MANCITCGTELHPERAAKYNYCRPTLNEEDAIHIVAGRHPVIEQAQTELPFISNDANLSNSHAQLLIIDHGRNTSMYCDPTH